MVIPSLPQATVDGEQFLTQSHQICDCQLRHRFRAASGYIHHGNAMTLGGLHVDGVQTHSMHGDDLQLLGTVDHVPGHMGPADDNGIQVLRVVKVIHDGKM